MEVEKPRITMINPNTAKQLKNKTPEVNIRLIKLKQHLGLNSDLEVIRFAITFTYRNIMDHKVERGIKKHETINK